MNDIDHKIREALHAVDDEWMKDFDEQSIHEMVFGVFQGKSRWLSGIGIRFYTRVHVRGHFLGG